jgi:predicted porin
MKKYGFSVLIVLLFSSGLVQAQKQIDNQNNAWYMYFGNHKITDRWGIHTEYQWRRHDLGQTWQQSLARVGVDYYTKQGPQLTAGYGWIVSYPYGKQPIKYSFNENRIWQQAIITSKVGRFNFNHRYRLEQRFLEQKSYDSIKQEYVHLDEFKFKQRARYRFMVSIPLNHKEMADNTWFVSLYEEVFLGFGKNIEKNIMEQNRISATVGYRFTKDFNIQAGYLNQFVQKGDGIHAENNHNLQIGVTYNFDWRKPKVTK